MQKRRRNEKKLYQIGEFDLIERIARKFNISKSVVKGIGDDTAVISYKKDRYLLLTTDMLVEGVHFSRRGANFFQIGRKSLAVNISDIAAMGGIPRYAVISAAFPRATPLSIIDNIMRGIGSIAEEFKVDIVGGDTVRSQSIILNISLLGEVKKGFLILRSGAKAGDLIFVTGNLGNTRRLKQFNFIPRVKEAQDIIKRFRPSSMIDISDGLVSDLHRIARESSVGAVIFEQMIPLAPQASLNQALYDGEDFELLFTMPLESARKFYKEQISPLSCIGKIVEKKKGLTLIDKKAGVSTLKEKGFKHF
ncbi:MAG: thiamine-monophosphate kinase [Candidatus Omnitrophica bacterium]|nr:thiamine-monophosphate kinase [Candidatus Omnitrophota bacterium]